MSHARGIPGGGAVKVKLGPGMTCLMLLQPYPASEAGMTGREQKRLEPI